MKEPGKDQGREAGEAGGKPRERHFSKGLIAGFLREI